MEIKEMNTNTDPLQASSSSSPPSVEFADAEAAYAFDSQGGDETLR